MTKNGTSLKGENTWRSQQIVEDDFRVKYFDDYVPPWPRPSWKMDVEYGVTLPGRRCG